MMKYRGDSLLKRIKLLIYITAFSTLVILRGIVAFLYSRGIDVMSITVNIIVIFPIGLLVIWIMRKLSKIITGPIIEPLTDLTNQIERLADESVDFDHALHSVELEKNASREIADLTNATNKLLNKMQHYNELITQSEKMASVGQLTAAITHEINTPLGAINANVNIIKMFAESISKNMLLDNPEEVIEMNNHVIEASKLSEEACERIDGIIRSLKTYSRIDQAEFMPADINESVRSVIALTTNLHKNRITLKTEYGELPEVSCHIGLINQVFMNIFINAIQAIEGEGEVRIKTSSDDINIYVSISDSGCGIDEKNLINIFRYGFTTKQPGSGSGIGLALSNNIIKKHSGSICVHSEIGFGSEFEVILPIEQSREEIDKKRYGAITR